YVVAETVGKQRADGPVDHAGRQDRALAGPAFPPEPYPGDAADGVHALLVIHQQREKVDALARLLGHDGGDQDHRVAVTDEDGPVGLLGQLARLDDQRAAAHFRLKRPCHQFSKPPGSVHPHARRMQTRAAETALWTVTAASPASPPAPGTARCPCAASS